MGKVQLKAAKTLTEMFPKFREDLYYTAPELISTRIWQMVGINIDALKETDDVRELVMSNIGRCRYGPPAV